MLTRTRSKITKSPVVTRAQRQVSTARKLQTRSSATQRKNSYCVNPVYR